MWGHLQRGKDLKVEPESPMTVDVKLLNETVEEFLSAMPPEQVSEQSREIVRSYLDSRDEKFGDIRWVELNAQNTPVRGGISSAETMSTRLITNWSEYPWMEEIVEIAQQEDFTAGALYPSSLTDQHYWCVPYRYTDPAAPPENRVRVIQLNEGLTSQVLELFNQDAGLTSAETRIIFQILLGMSAPKAAEQDNVSVETKRSQLKSATAKLNCNGQTELVRLIVTQMIHLLYLCESETSHMHLTEDFTVRFFGDKARLSVQRLSNGNLVRYWEFGPRDGTPLMALHGYLFPLLVLQSEKELQKHKIRLILPLRSGFLDSQSAGGILQLEKLAEENLENLELFVQSISKEPIPLVGHIMGAVYAMLLAKRSPNLFSKVISASTFVMHEGEKNNTFATQFTSGLRKLANNVGIYEVAIRQFQKVILMNERMTKITLRRLFRESPHDLAVINGDERFKPVFEWFQMISLNSVLGISSDLNLMSGSIEKYVRDVPVDLHFIHSADDPYTKPEFIKSLARNNARSTCTVLKEGGHYASASRPEIFWNAVAEKL